MHLASGVGYHTARIVTTSIVSTPERVWVDVDRSALIANARTVAASAQVPLLPMIKADAYGLGAIEVARALDAVDPWGFGVATLDEAAALRAARVTRRILVFTPFALACTRIALAIITSVCGVLNDHAFFASTGSMMRTDDASELIVSMRMRSTRASSSHASTSASE